MFAVMRSPSEILFGPGMRSAIPWLAAREGRRVFVIADTHLSESQVLDDLIEKLGAEGLSPALCLDVTPELPSDLARDVAAEAARHDADLIVSVGGGSCIDLGKVVSTLLKHGGMPSDYYGEFAVPGPVVPLIAVPTTAGTGSEATPVAVVTDAARGTKIGISSPHLIPAVAVCDPELTISCPASVTASAGADALSHCIEALTSRSRPGTGELPREQVFIGRSRITDTLAREGIAAIVDGLPTAYRNPNDAVARTNTMYGSLLAGLAFGTAGTAAAHALQYPIGALTGSSHGVGVGCLLPYVMAFNRPERVAEMAEVARLLGGQGDDLPLSYDAPALVASFLSDLEIPRSLSEIGVTGNDRSVIAEGCLQAARLAENNPRELTVAAATMIVSAAIDGDLDLLLDRGRVATSRW